MRSHLFVSIPRTGTNSVRKSLGIRRASRTNHRTAQHLREDFGERVWEQRFTFTFVRNPYDRLLSYFRYCKTIDARMPPHWRKHYAGNFKQWVAAGCSHHFHDALGAPTAMWPYLLDENGKVMVDFVGRVENFSVDFRRLCRELGTCPKRLVHINQSRRVTNYRSYYDKKTRELAEQICGRDAEVFGYKF